MKSATFIWVSLILGGWVAHFILSIRNFHITKTFLCAKHFQTTSPLPAQQNEESEMLK
jgi:hypothetical protein